MTTHRIDPKIGSKSRSLMAIAVIALFAIAAFFLTRPVTMAQSVSPVAGLITLRASAQQAMPYEQAIANGQPTLVEFYADWCTTCQAMAPTLETLHHQF
ncbi:MAG: thioredoxin domain-containing protein, partial [Cyanobacteria bacterium P01_D01_bin.115]